METIKRFLESILSKINKKQQRKALKELTKLTEKYCGYRELEKDNWS